MVVEFFGFNRNFLFNSIGSASKELEIRNGTINGFVLRENQLVSANNDPTVVFSDIDVPITSILLRCEDNIPGSSQSQLFYRGPNQEFTEIRSIRFALESKDPVYFPIPTDVDVLRLDLVGQPNVAVTCQDIVINPKMPFEITWVRAVGYLAILILTILWFSVIPNSFQKKASTSLYRYGHWILCIGLLLIGTIYEITIKYDSAHLSFPLDLYFHNFDLKKTKIGTLRGVEEKRDRLQ